MTEEKPQLEAPQPKVAFSTLRNIHRRNRERVQDAFLENKKNFSENAGLMADVSKMMTRKEMEGDVDQLTSLLNRNGFNKRFQATVSEARRTGDKIWGVVFDADGLKNINDTEGHEAGDKYIAKIGEIFTENARSMDLAGRTGGDEFIVILKDPGDNIREWWERMNSEFVKKGIRISGGAIEIDTKNPTRSLEQADEAMYAAKLSKGNGSNKFMIADFSNSVLSYSGVDATKAA